MRSLSIIFAACVIALSVPISTGSARAEENCTGDNCKSQGQGNDGHECHGQKKEPTVS
jgi:hypothetical protein